MNKYALPALLLVVGLVAGTALGALFFSSSDAERIQQLEDLNSTLIDQVANLQNQNAILQGQTVNLTAQVTQLQADKYALQIQVLTLQTQNANLSAQVSALQSQVTSLQAQVTQQIKQISNLTIENNNLTAQVTALESQVSTLQSQVTSLQAQVTDLEAQITALEALVPTPPPKEGDPGSSRFFPLNIGKSINVQFTSGYPEVTFIANITIHNIVRGDAAWDMLYTYYDGNTPPAPGYEYILANITFRLVMASDIFTSYTVWSHSFDAVSKDGVVYNYVFVLEPEPALSNEVYQGATVTGWAAFMVSVVDNHPVLSFGTDYDGTGGGWFKLY